MLGHLRPIGTSDPPSPMGLKPAAGAADDVEQRRGLVLMSDSDGTVRRRLGAGWGLVVRLD